ncbi:MAG: LLM class flavin-dependent oxidoreductase [bacterium]|nr:LLM class flavin-dependent oxidoreductase [Acidimicrobiia bacterium]MCY4649495.1 LLM class flavin-dependent oxidoreductase [bacterium]
MPPPSPSAISIGMVVQPDETHTTLEMIGMADRARVDTVWLTAGRLRPDALTILAAATQTTTRVRLGTAVIPIWPRHPLALAQQVRALESLAPGRIRLGVGPSTAAAMSPYGAGFRRPLSHLWEYVTVLRTLFETGRVDYRGEFLRAKGRIPAPLPTPVLASALGEGAFRFCGEVTDGAITWVCPPRYVKDTGLPALESGAASVDRDPPPVVLCVPTLASQDAHAVKQAAQQYVSMYTRFQYYREMFQKAGHPPADGPISEALVRELVVHGSVEEVATRLRELASWSEVMVFPLTGGLTDREGWDLCLEAVNLAGQK